MNRSLIILAMLLLASVGVAASTSTNALEALKTRFEAARLETEKACRKQKADALAGYGSGLTAVAEQLKQKGDLEGYLAAQQEVQRFAQQQTVVTNASSAAVAGLAEAYAVRVKKAQADADLRNIVLQRQYVGQLDTLVKQLTKDDKIEDAKAAKRELDNAEFMLAEREADQPDQPELAARGDSGTGSGQTNQEDRVALPNGVEPFQTHYYAAFQSKKADGLIWEEAEEACKEMGGHLACITDAAENAFLLAILPRNSFAAWIGGFNNPDKKNRYRWVDGSAMIYENWAKEMPWRSGFAAKLSLVGKKGASSGSDGLWKPMASGKMLTLFVCEWKNARSIALKPELAEVMTDPEHDKSLSRYAGRFKSTVGTYSDPTNVASRAINNPVSQDPPPPPRHRKKRPPSRQSRG